MSADSKFRPLRPVPAATDLVDRCPGCGADLRGEPIPAAERERRQDGLSHYSRQIMVKGLRDDSVCWGCPDCDCVWPAQGSEPPAYLQQAIDRDQAEANTRPRSRLSPLAG